MKPILLEIEGFNSFATKQIIDFEKLTSLGLFGIFGKTGSGKTTILDAIIYSLYANIPRGANNIINADCKKASIRYIFSIKGTNAGTYEIQRTVSKGKNEDEMLLSKADSSKKAKLTKIEDKENFVIADTKREVDKKIIQIIGLDYEDFIKTVVLPQGEFSAFLKEKNKDRKDMLERLFSLQKYGDELSEKIKKYKSSYEIIQRDYEKELSDYEMVNQDSINQLQKEFLQVQEDILKLEKRYDYLNKVQKEIEILEKYKLALDESQNKLLELEKWSDKIEDIRQKCKKLEKLTGLQETIQNYRQLLIVIPKDEQQLNEIKNKIKELELIKNKLLEEKNKIDSQIKELPNINKQIEDIKIAIQIKKNIQSLNLQKENIDKVKLNLQKNQNGINQQIQNLIQNLQDINVNINSQEEIIKQNTISSSYKEMIRIADSNIDKQNQNKKEISDIDLEIQNYLNQIEEKTKNIDLDKKIEQDLINQINKIELKEDKIYTIENYEQNDIYHKKLENANEILKNNLEEIQKNTEILSKNQEELKNLNQKLKNQISLKEEIQKNLDTKQKQDLIIKIKSNLKNGDECPVCHNTYHINEDEIVDIITNENILTEELDQIIESISATNSQIAIIQNQNQLIENQNKKLNDDIQNTNLSLNGKDLNQEIEKCLKYKEDYKNYLKLTQEINKELKEKENSLNNIQKSIDINQNNIKNIENIITTLKEKQKKRQEISQTLEKTIKDIVEKLEISQDNVKEKLKEIIKSEQIVEKTTVNLNKDKKISIDIQENIKKYQIEIENLSKQITNYEIESEKLNSSIKIEFAKLQDKTLFEKENLEQILNQKQELISKIEQDSNQNAKNIEDSDKSIQDLIMQKTKLQTKIDIDIKNFDKYNITLENFKTSEKYNDLEEIFTLNEEYPKLSEKQKSLQNYENQLNEAITLKNTNKKQYETQKEKLDSIQKEEHYSKDIHLTVKNSLDENRKKYGYLENKLENEKIIFEKKKDILEKSKENSKILDEVMQIEKLFKAKAFVQFLSKYQLNYVCKKASQILESISAGRFELSIDDEGEFIISDFQNGGIRRLPATLSGGETFLVSLSLALALSSQIQLKGNAPLEFFFMDEGFGTLDSHTLDTALECLKKLKNNNLSIGIISHIEKIKEFVPIKLEITQDTKTNTGSTAKIITG